MFTCQIETVDIQELQAYMRLQAEDAFPVFKDEEWLRSFSAKLHAHAEFCICRDGGRPVGMIAFYANGQGADFAYISHVYVSPDYRKQGTFSRMLDAVKAYSISKGFTEIRLEVNNDNKSACSAYSRKGFVQKEAASDHSFYMALVL